jgi:hypothetical protein
MAKSGLQNEKNVHQLLISGSTAVKSKSPFGVHFFEETNYNDGVIGAKLSKPKYDVDELVKSIDTTITELIPQTAPILPATVLKTIYDAALATIDDLSLEIQSLQFTQSFLNSRISELELVTQSLLVDNDNEKLKAASAQNIAQVATSRVQSSVIDLQNAIQKATAEAIERVSLAARVEMLQGENETLKDQLYGRQGAVLEGQDTTEDFGVLVLNRTINTVPGLLYYAQLNVSNSNPESDRGWLNGPGVQIENFSANPITITVEYPSTIINPNNNANKQVGVGGILKTPASLTVPAGQKKTLTFSTKDDTDSKNLNKLFVTKDRAFPGKIIIKSSTGTSLELPITFRKQSGKNYTGN